MIYHGQFSDLDLTLTEHNGEACAHLSRTRGIIKIEIEKGQNIYRSRRRSMSNRGFQLVQPEYTKLTEMRGGVG